MMYSSNWVAEDFQKVKKIGKRYKKTNVYLSSLLTKRRSNRRSKCPSLLSDVLLTNIINRLKTEDICCTNNLKKTANNLLSNNISDLNNTSNKTNSDTEIDSFLGMDIFFEKLKYVKVLPNPICEKDPYTTSNEDIELQDLVDNFIETGMLHERFYSSNNNSNVCS